MSTPVTSIANSHHTIIITLWLCIFIRVCTTLLGTACLMLFIVLLPLKQSSWLVNFNDVVIGEWPNFTRQAITILIDSCEKISSTKSLQILTQCCIVKEFWHSSFTSFTNCGYLDSRLATRTLLPSLPLLRQKLHQRVTSVAS